MVGNPGISKLAHVMIGLTNAHLPDKATMDWADFGTIQDDYSLLPDHFPVPFPKGSYAVNDAYLPPINPPIPHELWNTTDDALVGVTDTGASSSGASLQHNHTENRPSIFRPLAPGDRVLIVYANDTDPCVVARVHWSF